jgi:hypothetical protein
MVKIDGYSGRRESRRIMGVTQSKQKTLSSSVQVVMISEVEPGQKPVDKARNEERRHSYFKLIAKYTRPENNKTQV